MSDERAIDEVLRAAFLPPSVSRLNLSGGCIHRVTELTLTDGSRVVAKTNRRDLLGLFEEEAAGLRALAETAAVLVPRPLAVLGVDEWADRLALATVA